MSMSKANRYAQSKSLPRARPRALLFVCSTRGLKFLTKLRSPKLPDRRQTRRQRRRLPLRSSSQ
jgi:hypothetical protein